MGVYIFKNGSARPIIMLLSISTKIEDVIIPIRNYTQFSGFFRGLVEGYWRGGFKRGGMEGRV